MTTKALFITALEANLGGDLDGLFPIGEAMEFVRSSGDILTKTAHGLVTGQGPFKVMTTNGDAPSGIVVAKHSETFMLGTAMVVTDVLIVDGKSYTLIATPADDGDVDLGTTDAEVIMNLAHAINQDVDVAATSYDVDTTTLPAVKAIPLLSGADGAVAHLILQARSLDSVVGDAITVTSVDTTMAVDNATMENGATGTDYFAIRLDANTFSLATTRALADAGTAVTLADAGTGVHTLVTTGETLSGNLAVNLVGVLANIIETVLDDRLTATGVRTMPAAENIRNFWSRVIAAI